MLRAVLLVLVLASSAGAAELKCKGTPNPLTADWVADCEAYYRSGECTRDMQKTITDRRSRLPGHLCTDVTQRIDLFKQSQK